MEITAENFKAYTVIFLHSSMVEMGQLSWHTGGVWARQPGFDSQQRQEIFLYSTASRLWFWTNQPSNPMGTGGYFPGVKRLRHEADHSPSFTTKVKNGGAILCSPCLHGVVLN
jgi:hypothetical protein